MSIRRHVGWVLLVWVMGAACAKAPGDTANTEPDAAPSAPKSEFQVCQDPRPEMCTREYLPVCAHTMTGGLETRPNACVACADTKILGHRPEACR